MTQVQKFNAGDYVMYGEVVFRVTQVIGDRCTLELSGTNPTVLLSSQLEKAHHGFIAPAGQSKGKKIW